MQSTTIPSYLTTDSQPGTHYINHAHCSLALMKPILSVTTLAKYSALLDSEILVSRRNKEPNWTEKHQDTMTKGGRQTQSKHVPLHEYELTFRQAIRTTWKRVASRYFQPSGWTRPPSSPPTAIRTLTCYLFNLHRASAHWFKSSDSVLAFNEWAY